MENISLFEYKIIPKDCIMGFKIFADDYSSSKKLENNFDKKFNLHWKDAIYPQKSIKSALGYLPNYYDRGYEEACLFALRTKENMNLLICKSDIMKNNTLEADKKAEFLFKELKKNFNLENKENLPLMKFIGENLNIILYVLDKDDYEFILPICLYNKDNFETTN